jgi:N-acetylmuramoyl-L-alanine amidase
MIIRLSICLSFLFVLILTAASPVHVTVQILNVRHWIAPASTRVVIDMSDVPEYQTVREGDRLNIEFPDTTITKSIPASIVLKKSGIFKIRILTKRPQSIIIQFELDKLAETNVFKLKKIDDKPYRVVVDVDLPEKAKQEAEQRQQVKVQKKKRIIIIDPGHGGDDPGAIGPGKTREKDVVLKIGKKLKSILNQTKGYQAFLTRSGDYYVPFKKRTGIAHEYGADLFISIHANAARNRNAYGSAVYCLSLGGAGNEAARLLANSENMADIIGGSSNGEGKEEADPIVLNMCQTQTINQSKIFGNSVLKQLEVVNPLKFQSVQEAPFRVLKLPDIPSILVETAFVSNPSEEQKLRKSSFQGQIAKALAGSIEMFFEGEALAEGQQTGGTRKEISSRNSNIQVKAEDRKKPVIVQSPVYYRVKKGETLERIARENGTTLSMLLKINHMGLHDTLLAGQKIQLPVDASQ